MHVLADSGESEADLQRTNEAFSLGISDLISLKHIRANHIKNHRSTINWNGPQPTSDGLQRTSDGLQRTSDGLQPTSKLLAMASSLIAMASNPIAMASTPIVMSNLLVKKDPKSL